MWTVYSVETRTLNHEAALHHVLRLVIRAAPALFTAVTSTHELMCCLSLMVEGKGGLAAMNRSLFPAGEERLSSEKHPTREELFSSFPVKCG